MKQEFRTGIFFSAVGKYFKIFIRLGVNIILARILTPEDFGVVAIVQVFLTFFDLLADMGFGPAIIQNKDLDDRETNVIFKFSLLFAVVLGLIIGALGPFANDFFNADIYIPIFLILSINVFFYGIMTVPRSLILKQKDFKFINFIEIISSIVNGVVSVLLALAGFNYYSIIIGQLLQVIVMSSVFIYYTKVNLKEKLSKGPIMKVWNFARNQFAFNFINYFSRNLDKILIGRYFSESALGYYNKSYQLSLYPNQVLTSVITPVVQPIMSEYENRLEVIKNTFFKITNLLANIGFPLTVFCFFAADNIILTLYGDQWVQSIPVFRILALTIWEQMIASSTGAFYQSTNKTNLLLVTGIQSTVLNVIAIIAGVMTGRIELVAAFIVVSFLINFAVNNYLLLYHVFDSGFLELLTHYTKPVLMGLIQLVVFVLMPELNFTPFINLVIQGVIFGLFYIIGLFATGQFNRIVSLIK